jgi:NADH dehydrogenase
MKSENRREKIKILIVGAGFAGLAAAKALADNLSDLSLDTVEITIVSDRNYHLFTPLLYQIASGLANPYHVIQPVRGIAARLGARFYEASVRKVDFRNKIVETDKVELHYDYLILAPGSETNDFNIPGVKENALFLKKLKDGEAIRNQLLKCLETASAPKTEMDERRRLLSFVVVGGGSSGVELAGTLADYLRILHKYYTDLDLKDIARIYLIEAEMRLIPGLDERMSQACKTVLTEKGISVILGKKVKSVGRREIELSDGSRIDSETIIWTAGIRPNSVISDLNDNDVQKRNGRIVVDRQLRLPLFSEVYALGDCAYVPIAEGSAVPATAAAAIQEGRFAGAHLAYTVEQPQKAAGMHFTYRDRGVMLSLGRFEGVAVLGSGILIKGLPGWLAWRFVHLAYISTLRSKFGILFDWTVAIFYRRIVSRTNYK